MASQWPEKKRSKANEGYRKGGEIPDNSEDHFPKFKICTSRCCAATSVLFI